MTVLAPMDVPGRAGRVRERLADAGCQALLITELANIRWLTGFTGSAALLLVRSDELVFVSDGRYRDQAAEQLAAAGVEARIEISATDQQQLVATAAKGVRRLGLEATAVTWAQQRSFANDWFPDAELIPTEGVIEQLREVKDEGEVARIEAAAGIADAALDATLAMLREAPEERDVALELELQMRRNGAAGPAFETIVGSGPNGARPHARAGDRRLVEGDLVVIDMGAVVDGYHSDMTRTFVLGEPTDTQRRMLEVVTASQAEGVRAALAGARGADVDAVCRRVIAEAGWGDAFLHGTGHGVGLHIHEDPRVSSRSEAVLAAGNVITIEPGVYLPYHGGVRVEDTVLVTDTAPRVLTGAPKDPILR
jgi:Xaa-Pro aminopeptidase